MQVRTRKSLSDALFETNYQSKVAKELWLNIGGKEYRLVGKKVKLGRAVDNDIVLEDKSCSRYHAMIRIEAGRVILEDLKSRNGVRVNGHKISRVELRQDAEIQIGDLPGTFFEKEKAAKRQHSEVTSTSALAPDFLETAGEEEKFNLIEKFKSLPKPARLASMGMLPVFLFFFMIASNQSSPSEEYVEEELGYRFELSEADIVDFEVPRAEFEACREAEDLGNFRGARTCFEALPLSREVYTALQRVVVNQHEMTQKRFLEGEKALQNKYYDLAILKLQEVMLIADDQSELRNKIPRMIEEAKEGKRLL